MPDLQIVPATALHFFFRICGYGAWHPDSVSVKDSPGMSTEANFVLQCEAFCIWKQDVSSDRGKGFRELATLLGVPLRDFFLFWHGRI